MASTDHKSIIKIFTKKELTALKNDANICNHDRRTFLKWGSILSSQAIVGGGILNLLTGQRAQADDTFDNVVNWVYSVCGYCSFGCGLNIGVNSYGEAVSVRGNENHPTNDGRVCVKGLFEHKILDAPDRGKWPMIRDENGNWEKITWDEAATILSQKIIDGVYGSELVEPKGADSIATYNTGQWTLEEYYAFGKLGKGAIGTATMDSNTRLCMAAAVVGYLTTFGSDGPPGCYDDVENTDCFFVFGMNPAEMHPQLWRRIAKARRTLRAPKLIVVDPRRTLTARSADLHLALKPGTNLALINGIIQQIIVNGDTDTSYIEAHTRNYDAMAATVANYTPEHVSEITGCPAADIEKAAKWIGESQESLSLFIQGVYQSMGATDTVRMICAMHLIMGKIGRPGSSPFSITGQATAMSNREAGASSALAGYRNYYNPDHVGELEDFWNIDRGKIPPHKPTVITSNRDYQDINSHVEMMRNGELSVFWIQCTNPAVTLPDLNKLYSYMSDPEKRPYIVVQDIYEPMECTHFADMFLPAAMWGEKTGVYTCSERKVNLGRQAVQPAGHELRTEGYGAYADLEITKMVADKIASMDKRFADKDGNSLVGFNSYEEAFEEWKQCSAGTICDMSGMSYDKIEANNGIQWPSTPGNVYGGTRMYSDGRFNTNWADTQGGTEDKPWIDPENLSRAYLWAKDYIEAPEVPDSEYPFWLITGRVIEHFHSRTKTKRVPQLHEMVPENYVELHPDDAKKLDVSSGDLVRLNTRRGEIVIKALVVGTVQRGQVFVPMHFADLDPQDVIQNKGRLTATNRLTMNWVDPDCKQPIYKHCAVSLIKA